MSYIEIGLNHELLKDLELVITCAQNRETFYSQKTRTQHYLRKCDIMFYLENAKSDYLGLSPLKNITSELTASFDIAKTCDADIQHYNQDILKQAPDYISLSYGNQNESILDVDVIYQNMPKAFFSIYIIGTNCHESLLKNKEEEEHNLLSAYCDTQYEWEGLVKREYAKITSDITYKIKYKAELVSSLIFSIARKKQHNQPLNKEETNIVNDMRQQFTDFDQVLSTVEDYFALSGINSIKDEITKAKEQKQNQTYDYIRFSFGRWFKNLGKINQVQSSKIQALKNNTYDIKQAKQQLYKLSDQLNYLEQVRFTIEDAFLAFNEQLNSLKHNILLEEHKIFETSKKNQKMEEYIDAATDMINSSLNKLIPSLNLAAQLEKSIKNDLSNNNSSICDFCELLLSHLPDELRFTPLYMLRYRYTSIEKLEQSHNDMCRAVELRINRLSEFFTQESTELYNRVKTEITNQYQVLEYLVLNHDEYISGVEQLLHQIKLVKSELPENLINDYAKAAIMQSKLQLTELVQNYALNDTALKQLQEHIDLLDKELHELTF